MSSGKAKNPTDELLESLMKDLGKASDDAAPTEIFKMSDGETKVELAAADDSVPKDENGKIEFEVDQADVNEFLGLKPDKKSGPGFMMSSPEKTEFSEHSKSDYDGNRQTSFGANDKTQSILKFDSDHLPEIPKVLGELAAEDLLKKKVPLTAKVVRGEENDPTNIFPSTDSNMVTKAIVQDLPKVDNLNRFEFDSPKTSFTQSDSEKTVAVAGYQQRNISKNDDFPMGEKISVGINRSSYSSSWGGGQNSSESNLNHADNLRIAQDKILELESENEKLRLQNEQLMSASEIIRERADLLSTQLSEFKNDKDNLEESFRNEVVLIKNHLARKENELQKAQLKIDELESRLKFDMKKIRVRERELENRLELVRAEKNAVVKNKDEQILELRRKMDFLQMEVDSYRQKCVELNKLIETNQESFKRTTRALRLAMANLELQEENKSGLKKAE